MYVISVSEVTYAVLSRMVQPGVREIPDLERLVFVLVTNLAILLLHGSASPVGFSRRPCKVVSTPSFVLGSVIIFSFFSYVDVMPEKMTLTRYFILLWLFVFPWMI